MRSIALNQKEKERFWGKVNIGDPNECWEWVACRNIHGYGIVNIKAETRISSRVAWTITHGEIPDGLFVCHTCDNPPCCNPKHLFLGTVKENAIDMSSKGRSRRGRKTYFHGELISSSKLREEDVVEIKKMLRDGNSCARISRIYGVTPEAISSIKCGKNWAWLE